MTTLALIAVHLAENVLAISAHDRWQGLKNIKSDTSFISNGWVKLALVLVLAGSVITFVVVSLIKKRNERKVAEMEFADGVARKQLTQAEADTLIEIANRAGLKRAADIFVLSDAFEAGLDILFKESFADGNPTNRTVELERHLANLKAKINYRKAGKGGWDYSGGTYEKPAGAKSAVSIAIIKDQGDSPPGFKVSSSEFLPAIVTGLVGRVLFIETTLSANVGDRVFVVIGSGISGDGSGTPESVENIGTIEQSIGPADTERSDEPASEMLKEPNAHRLGINFADLSELQAAQLAKAIKDANGRSEMEQALRADSNKGAK
jgi:hypothetical protein